MTTAISNIDALTFGICNVSSTKAFSFVRSLTRATGFENIVGRVKNVDNQRYPPPANKLESIFRQQIKMQLKY